MAKLLEVKDLATYFFTQEGVVKAVDGISYDLEEGEVIGIVGESGCGKSVSALSIMRLVANPPGRTVRGEVFFEGEDLLKMDNAEMRHIRGNRIAMVFQEPMTSLNPVLTIGRQLTETLLHILMMDLVVSRQPGLTGILSALGFTVASSHAPEFGELPLTYVSAPVATKRPPDQLMLQIAEISGSPVFEEVVRIEDIVALKTPLKHQLMEAARSHAGDLLEAAGG